MLGPVSASARSRLIGTPPNIIIAAIREEQLGESYGMFDFAPVGGVAAIAGLLFVALIGWRMIPKSEGKGALAEAEQNVKAYTAELSVPEKSC